MGAQILTLEIDTGLMDRLRAAGVDPRALAERILARKAIEAQSAEERCARVNAWRREHQAELDSHDRFIADNGLWT